MMAVIDYLLPRLIGFAALWGIVWFSLRGLLR